MKRVNWSQEFQKFLESKQKKGGIPLWDRYLACFYFDPARRVFPETIDNVIDVYAPEVFVRGAFFWPNTPEGYKFWYRICEEWQKKLIEIKIKKAREGAYTY